MRWLHARGSPGALPRKCSPRSGDEGQGGHYPWVPGYLANRFLLTHVSCFQFLEQVPVNKLISWTSLWGNVSCICFGAWNSGVTGVGEVRCTPHPVLQLQLLVFGTPRRLAARCKTESRSKKATAPSDEQASNSQLMRAWKLSVSMA